MWKYFSKDTDPKLFTCQETGEEGIDFDFVSDLDELREDCGFPFIINSGYRSSKHSKEKIKNNPGWHTKCAADIRCYDGRQRYILVKNAIRLGFSGIGIASGFIHVDKRDTTPVIWTY